MLSAMKQEYPQFFHIGLPKTGTTTIQKIFRSDSRINLISNRYFNTHQWWSEKYNYCVDNKVNVVSEENQILQSVNLGKLFLTLSRIARIAPNAQIIVTIREQRALLTSRYKYNFPYFDGFHMSFQEWLKTGQGMDYLSVCMYDSLYKTIRAFFKEEQIHFLLFEDLKFNFEGFVNDLYSIIGIDNPENLDSNTKKNVTRSDGELLFIKKLNRYKIFNKKSKLAIKEGELFEWMAKKMAPKQINNNFLKWGDSEFYKNIENDFRIENLKSIKRGLLSEEKISKFGYLL